MKTLTNDPRLKYFEGTHYQKITQLWNICFQMSKLKTRLLKKYKPKNYQLKLL